MAVKKTTEDKIAETKPAAKESAAKKPAAEKKPAVKKPAAKKPTAKKVAEVIIQSPLGGEITSAEILDRVGNVDKVYVRVDQNKAYWVNGEETGSDKNRTSIRTIRETENNRGQQQAEADDPTHGLLPLSFFILNIGLDDFEFVRRQNSGVAPVPPALVGVVERFHVVVRDRKFYGFGRRPIVFVTHSILICEYRSGDD